MRREKLAKKKYDRRNVALTIRYQGLLLELH